MENALRVEEQMKYFTEFCRPHFFVTQTGSLIREINQIGMFHDDYIKKLKPLTKKYDLPIKEHNADYLNRSQIKKRKGLISAMNIAPQLGILQTQLSLYKSTLYGIDASNFLEVAYRSHKWEKWLHKNTSSNELLCSIVAGHYSFTTDQYKDLYENISRYEDFDTTIEAEMHKIFDYYITNL